MTTLSSKNLTLGYGRVDVVEGLDLDILPGRITCLVGANASGKSTVLRALARLLPARSGQVLLDGRDLHAMPTRQVARRLGLLPQSPESPDGITVTDLVTRGRHPHQSIFRQWSDTDRAAVAEAMRLTSVLELARRPVDGLSGGQRQRAWIAMALAQETELLLLDEPTTFLDIAHQMEVLDLLADLNAVQGRTVVMVLHDLNQAARYAHHLVAMKDGRVIARGAPSDVVTAELVADVFGLACRVLPDPETGTPLVIPMARTVRHYPEGSLP